LGDIDNDGELEIVIGCGNSYDPNSCGAPHAKLYAWNDNGSSVGGFPQEPPSPNSWLSGSFAMPFTPILADIDGDGHVEILVVHIGAHGITVMDAVTGAADNTSHLFSGGLSAPPLVDDVDNDGRLEVLAGGGASDQATSSAVIRIWDENGSANVTPPWPMHRHDVKRTGRFALPPKLGFPSELRFLHQSGSGSVETRYAAIQNLSDGQFNWTITNPIAGLQIIPTSGTVVTQTSVRLNLTTTGFPSGWSKLSGNLTIAGTYPGTVVQSSPMTATVWLYIGDVSRVYLPIIKRNQ
jgi:FG-GAP-like repeat